jgi:hypothetical protein
VTIFIYYPKLFPEVLRYKIILVFVTLIFTGKAYCQTYPCNIEYKDGKSANRTRMIGLHENLLLISDTGSYKIVNVDKIARVKFDNGTYWKTGAAYGGAIGFVGGILVYNIWGKKKIKFLPKDVTLGTMGLFTIPCALIGALIGMNFRNIDVYELSKMNTYMKSKEIKFIMKDHAQYR